MHVLPHMREAGGGLAHFPPTFPSHAHRGQQVWAADVGNRCGQQMWATDVGNRCGQQMWATDVGSKHGTQPPNRGQAWLLG
jgi:hypothetical protein